MHFTFASVSRVCHIIKISDVLSKAFYIVLCKGGLPWTKTYISHLHNHREKILSAKEKSFWLSRAATGELPLLHCFPAFLYTRTLASMQTTVKLCCERGMDPLSWQIKPVWQPVSHTGWVCVRTIEDLGEVLPPCFSAFRSLFNLPHLWGHNVSQKNSSKATVFLPGSLRARRPFVVWTWHVKEELCVN